MMTGEKHGQSQIDVIHKKAAKEAAQCVWLAIIGLTTRNSLCPCGQRPFTLCPAIVALVVAYLSPTLTLKSLRGKSETVTMQQQDLKQIWADRFFLMCSSG